MVQVPTITSATLGSSVWGAGPSAVVVWSGRPVGRRRAGQQHLVARRHARTCGTSYSTFLANPFATYNFDDGWYLSSSPNITANWQYRGTKWTVPVGGGFGRIFRIGALPVDLSISTYYNVVKPTIGGRWQLSTKLTFVF